MGCGVPKESVKLFRSTPEPELLNYLDLCPEHDGHDTRVLPDGVAESRERPLLYFIENDRLSAETTQQREQLRRLRRTLGSRGEHAFLAVVHPGLVRVIPVSLDSRTNHWKEFHTDTPEARSLFARMGLGEYEAEGSPPEADYVYEAMFKLLTAVANNIVATGTGMERDDVLSLVGRALFLRFLRSGCCDGAES